MSRHINISCPPPSWGPSFLFFSPRLSHSFSRRDSSRTSESPRRKIFKTLSGRKTVSEKEDWSLIFLNQGIYTYQSLLFKKKKWMISFLYWKRAGIAKVSTIRVILGGTFCVPSTVWDYEEDIHTLPALQNKYPTGQWDPTRDHKAGEAVTRSFTGVWFSMVGPRLNGRFIPMEAW